MKDWLIYSVYIMFILIILIGVKKEKAIEKENYFQRMNLLRGLFALDIIIGHVAGQNMLPLMPFEKFSIISVAGFFFLSGSGLANSYCKKERYLHKIPMKIIYLICTTLLLYLIKIIVQVFLQNDLGYIPFNKWHFIRFYLEKTNWYIWELILLYIIFGIIYHFIHEKKNRVIIMSIITFLIGFCFSLNGLIEAWYYSILGFPFGIIFSEYFDEFIYFIHYWLGKLLISLFFLCGLLGHVFLKGNVVGSYITRNLFCISCITIIILVIEHIKIDNKAIRVCTLFSLELYLYQSLYLDLTKQISSEYFLRMLLVLSATFLTAILVYPINKYIKQQCMKILSRRK